MNRTDELFVTPYVPPISSDRIKLVTLIKILGSYVTCPLRYLRLTGGWHAEFVLKIEKCQRALWDVRYHPPMYLVFQSFWHVDPSPFTTNTFKADTGARQTLLRRREHLAEKSLLSQLCSLDLKK